MITEAIRRFGRGRRYEWTIALCSAWGRRCRKLHTKKTSMFDRTHETLEVADTLFAVIAYDLAHQSQVDEYLHAQRDEKSRSSAPQRSTALRQAGPTKEDLLARAKAKGLNL